MQISPADCHTCFVERVEEKHCSQCAHSSHCALFIAAPAVSGAAMPGVSGALAGAPRGARAGQRGRRAAPAAPAVRRVLLHEPLDALRPLHQVRPPSPLIELLLYARCSTIPVSVYDTGVRVLRLQGVAAGSYEYYSCS